MKVSDILRVKGNTLYTVHPEESLQRGIEIMAESRSILDPGALPDRMAVMPGNEGSGLSATQKAVCESFVFIPQYSAGTASLNVNVATALVLHHATFLRKN